MSRRDNMKRIYVGNLPPDVRTRDLEDLFYKFGKIAFIDLKTRRGPPFAFVEFHDYRDAEEAVKCRDGKDFDGCRLRVEFPRGKERISRFKNGFGDRHGSSSGGGRSSAPARRSKFRVKVTGLPTSGSWQDLKDHMREVGEVCFADVFKGGEGVVEFVNYDDMRYAIRKLNDTKFKSHEGESSYIKLKEDNGDSRSRSRSPISSRRRGSPSYSPATKRRGDSYSASRSRSRSRSPRHHKKSGDHHRSSGSHHHHKKSSSSRRPRSDSRSRSRSHSRSPSGSPRSNRDSSRHSSDRSRSRSKSASRTPDSQHNDGGKRTPSPARSNKSRSVSRSPPRHDKSIKSEPLSDRRSRSNSRSPSPQHDNSKSPARSDGRRSATNSRTPSPEMEKRDD